MMPMDNSSDPPLVDLTFESVEDQFGPIVKLDARAAYDVLTEIIHSPPWMEREESEEVFKVLIKIAGIQDDPDELESLGLDHIQLNVLPGNQ